MTWIRLRSAAFSIIGAILMLIGALVQGAGVDRTGTPLLMIFALFGLVMVLLVAFDVVYHAWRGEGQACRSCGHMRRLRSFRVSGACPNCGGG